MADTDEGRENWSLPTWQDVEYRALHDPVLHSAVTLYRRGACSREEALIVAALKLSEMRERMIHREIDFRYGLLKGER